MPAPGPDHDATCLALAEIRNNFAQTVAQLMVGILTAADAIRAAHRTLFGRRVTDWRPGMVRYITINGRRVRDCRRGVA